jgi:hypothetical protein
MTEEALKSEDKDDKNVEFDSRPDGLDHRMRRLRIGSHG